MNASEVARQRMTRVAWAVLLTSFALFLALVIGVPLGWRAYRLHATRPLYVVVRPTQGTLALQPGPRAQTILVKQIYEGVPEASVLELEAEQSAVLLAYAQEGASRPLVTLRLYGPLKLTLSKAEKPRFAVSPDAVRLALDVVYGRLTLLADPQQHAVSVSVETPQGALECWDGTATLAISSQSTRLEVYSGGAALLMRNAEQSVPPLTRAVLRAESSFTLETLGTPLINNGDFTAGFADWEAFTRRVEPPGKGGATLGVMTPRATLRVWRDADGVGESGLAQALGGRAVPAGAELYLKAAVRIEQQSVTTCGPRGERCPITLRLYYRDAEGKPRVWSQGFYAVGNSDPQRCLTCDVASPLRALLLQEWGFYESPNLLRLTPAPAQLDALELAADGQTYTVEFDDVILILKE